MSGQPHRRPAARVPPPPPTVTVRAGRGNRGRDGWGTWRILECTNYRGVCVCVCVCVCCVCVVCVCVCVVITGLIGVPRECALQHYLVLFSGFRFIGETKKVASVNHLQIPCNVNHTLVE